MASTAVALREPDPVGHTCASSRHAWRDRDPVLLATSNDTHEWQVRRLLTTLGWPVMSATSGEQALRMVAQYRRPLSLLIADVRLPGMSGIVLSEFLAEHQPGIPTLLMTDGQTSGVAAAAPRQHSAFVETPLTERAFLGGLKAATRNSRGDADPHRWTPASRPVGGLYFDLPLARAGGLRDCPTEPKLTGRDQDRPPLRAHLKLVEGSRRAQRRVPTCRPEIQLTLDVLPGY